MADSLPHDTRVPLTDELIASAFNVNERFGNSKKDRKMLSATRPNSKGTKILEDYHNFEISKANEVRDPLTGAYNRRYMVDKLNELRVGDKFCIVMVDVDHFKKVNDTHGHKVGDDVLRHVYSLLNANVRPNDMVARYGGEEFMILLKDYELNQNVEKRLENLRKEIEATPHNKRKSNQEPVRVTASFGYVFSDGKTDPTTLLDKADGALYIAKQTGRNQIVMAQSD